MWSAWNGILPYLLPLLGPLVWFLLLVSFGPCVFKNLTDFIKSQVDSATRQVSVHYHHLQFGECVAEDYNMPPGLPKAGLNFFILDASPR